MRDWVNRGDHPIDGGGFDAVLSTGSRRVFNVRRPDGSTLSVPLPDPVVFATGAAYFFVPPISAITGHLAA
jgi:hypothetical protein